MPDSQQLFDLLLLKNMFNQNTAILLINEIKILLFDFKIRQEYKEK